MKTSELRERLGKALGDLGLHDQRQINVGSDRDGPSPFLTTCSVSLAELERLAKRAEHLVELERTMYEQYAKDDIGAGPEFGKLNVALRYWSANHDFSMLVGTTEAPAESIP